MTVLTGDKSRLINLRGAVFALVLAFMLCAVPVYADATLYRGSDALGQIPARDGAGGFVISLADAGGLLGMSASVVGEELVLSRGSDSLRIVLGSVVAWHNHRLIPLNGASYVQDGRWWLDVPSSLNLLQYFAGHGGALRVEGGHSGAVASTPVMPAVPVTTVAAEPVVIVPVVETAVETHAEAPIIVHAPEPVAPPAVDTGDRVVVVSGTTGAAIQPAAPELSEQQMSIDDMRTRLSASGASNPSNPSSNSPGELRAVRWSASPEKIRAVLDSSDGTNPEISVAAGRIAIPFSSVVSDLRGVPSPYENVTAQLERNADGSGILFLSASGVRVERLVLDSPRRLVFDFVFTVPTVVRESPDRQPQAPMPTMAGVTTQAPRTPGRRLVVLDPGHGGRDPGAVANGIRESQLNLAIGLKMERALLDRGYDVRMTRRTDVFLRLRERTDIANNANADIFVSIHANALPPGRQARGFEIYVMDLPTDQDALELARRENREYLENNAENVAASDRRTELLLQILGSMQQNQTLNESTAAAEVLFRAGNDGGLPMRRVAQAPFYVLRGAAMPAVLLEVGFITNPEEARLLATPAYQQRIANAMAQGISNYLRGVR